MKKGLLIFVFAFFLFVFDCSDAKAAILSNGTYRIRTALSTSKVLDVRNGSTTSGTNVQLYDWANVPAQKWVIKHLGSDYYTITSTLSNNKVLDVKSAGKTNGTNVQLYSANNSNAQKWLIKSAGDGYYYIISKCNGLYVDVSNARTANGTNIQMHKKNGNKAQKFKFVKEIDAKQTIEDGPYTISSASNGNMVLDIANGSTQNGTNVQLATKNGSNAQVWHVKYLGKGYYSITSHLNQSKSLDIYSGGFANKTNIQLYSSNGTAAQKWVIKDAGNGYYNIISQTDNMYVDIAGGVAKNGANIWIYSGNGSNAQKFSFNKLTDQDIQDTIVSPDDGYYHIVSALNSTKALDVQGGRKNNGTNIQLYAENHSVAQTFYIKKLSNGNYSITSAMNPNTSLDVANSGTSNGTNVQLNKYNGASNQQWIFKDAGDGYVYITSKSNNLNLDVKGGTANNNTNIQMYVGNNTKAQKFKLVKNINKKVYTGIDVSHHQKQIDWKTISNSNLGFVIIRAGFGGDWTNQDDEQFKNNVAACEKYNIPYGLYLYSYASDIENANNTGAKNEADHMLRLIKEIGASAYKPNLGTKVFLDVEDKSVQDVSKDQLTNVADYFCSTIEKSGYSCGIYANKVWLTSHLDANLLAKNYDIWLAEWPDGVTTHNQAMSTFPSYNLTPYKYWQFASDGKINGITGRVDMDLGYDIFDVN